MSCRINKGRKWTSRILLEQMFHPQRSWFVTLTYDENTVPRTGDGKPTLDKSAALNWIKNTNNRIKGRFRYFVVGEYGDRTFRPHLHLAIFPDDDCSITDVLDRWTNGHTSLSEMDGKRAAYLCHYTAKKLTCPADERLEADMEPEFRASSRFPPIGSSALPALLHPYSQRAGSTLIAERGDVERTVRISGKIYPLDSYILRKMREALGIPLTHTGRIDSHPDYLHWHEVQEAQWEPEIHKEMEYRHAAKKKLRKQITNSL